MPHVWDASCRYCQRPKAATAIELSGSPLYVDYAEIMPKKPVAVHIRQKRFSEAKRVMSPIIEEYTMQFVVQLPIK
jgi:hypothetical protein